MKINVCRRHTLNYYDFTVQPGMLTGYDANNTPYVTNGYICADNEINVYFMRGQDKFGKYQWRKRKINSGTDGELYKTILRGIQKRGTATINIWTNYSWRRTDGAKKSMITVLSAITDAEAITITIK